MKKLILPAGRGRRLLTLVLVLGSLGGFETALGEAVAWAYQDDDTVITTDTTAPTITTFSIPATSTSLTVPIVAFSATDNVAVTGYLITLSSTKPSATASGWTLAPPTSYTFSSAGTHVLYAWAKDARGNVSASASASTTITLPSGGDTTPPTITAFSVPATSNSLTVPITAFAATDNVAVTGYLVTVASTKPSATATGWTPAPPTSYTFSSAGAKVLYAWAKDAAGNVSAPASASTTITLPTSSDTIPPTVTSFSIPTISGATTILILTFSATDNVGVTGYLLTETSTSPLASAAGWTSVPPSRYTFASFGTKTLFAWAKDAAGNVSSSKSAAINVVLPPIAGVPKSINSTSQNRSAPLQIQVTEQTFQQTSGYRVLAANDLGMHCADLDQRVASILPPYNILHAQVVKTGHVPVILDLNQVQVVYSAASNPQDPVQVNTIPASVFKTNFWNINPATGSTIAFDAFNPYYPAGFLALFRLLPDIGLPSPDLQQLYLGNGILVADQQQLPGISQPFTANLPQPFALFYKAFPFFINFPFGYTLSPINWFSAEGVPASPFDDVGRQNLYPLMRIQARAIAGNTLGLTAGSVIASLDTVTPISGEVNCRNCHSATTDGGNGSAMSGIVVATRFNDPMYGQVPVDVSIEWAYDTNILRLHDLRNGTSLQNTTPVSCQKCHYSPALDLAHVGPNNVNGRQQTTHHSFSRAMHFFHGSLGMFPPMPSPAGRDPAVRDYVLGQTCYQCHPGKTTQCFRGKMFDAGQACQDCHGNLSQIGNDFSQNAPGGGGFTLAGDFYTSSTTPRVPWANEPTCQSCHTGDVNSNLAKSSNVVVGPDGLRLIQAFHTNDANAKPIIAVNRRFAENQSGSGSTTKQVLFRLSVGHGGIFCEGCHGSTHAEWPNSVANANDNVAATQLQGHSGKIVECTTCHGNTLTSTDFIANFDANGWMKGPHGMHPVNGSWLDTHSSVYTSTSTPAGTCQACHGNLLQGSPLARTAVDRTYTLDNGVIKVIPKGTQVSCSLCHGNPLNGL